MRKNCFDFQNGDWTEASVKLSETDWAKNYPNTAKDIIEDLKNVQERMSEK
jgi:hypothetical protein